MPAFQISCAPAGPSIPLEIQLLLAAHHPEQIHQLIPNNNKGGRGHWTVNYTGTVPNVYSHVFLYIESKTLGSIIIFSLVGFKLLASKLFNPKFYSTEGIILFIISGVSKQIILEL